MTDEQTNVDRSPHWNAILSKIITAKSAGVSLPELAEIFEVDQNHAGLTNGLNHLVRSGKVHRSMGMRGSVPRVVYQSLYPRETARDRLDQEEDADLDTPRVPPEEN